MGPTALLGIVMAVVAFLVAGGIANQFAGPLSMPIACAAGFFTWKYFWDKDGNQMIALLNPPDKTWQANLPTAFGMIKDELDTYRFESPQAGLITYRVDATDDARGIIKAESNFSEHLGGAGHYVDAKRNISLQVQLIPEGSATRAVYKYQIFSPQGTGTIREVLRDTQAKLDGAVAKLPFQPGSP